MKTHIDIVTKTYDIPVTIKGAPCTVEGIDALMGRTGACVELALDHIVAHTVLGKIRDGLADAIVEAGFAKESKTVGDKTVDIKPDKHWFAKAFTALGWDAAKRQAVVQSISDSIGCDVSSTRGLSGGPTQEDVKNATALIDAIKAGRSTYERVGANLEGRNPGLDITFEDDGTFTVDTLAAALGFERRRIAAENRAKQDALLG